MEWGELVSSSWSSDNHTLSAWIFLRLLGLSYLAAFLSLGRQIVGLVGQRGILPATEFLKLRRYLGRDRFRRVPTLCWLDASDRMLKFLCYGGAFLALLLVARIASVPVLVLLWMFYLSVLTVCRIFLGYQWDILLLETGFLAIFLAPLSLLPEWPPQSSPSPIILWLLWWLLFRLMFASGYVKWFGGDPTWRKLRALSFHYETQPLPTWIGWYAHQLPGWFHRVSVILMFAIELFCPFLIFTPLRPLAGIAFLILMVLIAATGNYCFFNLITAALALLLFDDAFFAPLFPGWQPPSTLNSQLSTLGAWPMWCVLPPALLISLLSIERISQMFAFEIKWPKPLNKCFQALVPFRLVNSYGLFAHMTTSRPEIIIEGSDDGVVWEEYEFKWKPGDVRRAPRFVAPHQPRLDWQMWFAALGYYRDYPWFGNFLERLLEGSPDVVGLLKTNPFPEKAPRFIRAVLYDYHFTDFASRRATDNWWRRERLGLYSPMRSKGIGE
ncbi:MAG: lipase maturation factor family protein [Verrucomicrobia bacterium]|nr:lipase maturation factor family protein [Verrucomicrobiota bacterium]